MVRRVRGQAGDRRLHGRRGRPRAGGLRRRLQPVGGRRAVLEVVARLGPVGIDGPGERRRGRRRGPARRSRRPAGPGRRRSPGEDGESDQGREQEAHGTHTEHGEPPEAAVRSTGDVSPAQRTGWVGSGADAPRSYPWEAPLGAFPTPGGDTRFRVWAPRARELALDRRRRADAARAGRPRRLRGRGAGRARHRLRLRRRRRAAAGPVPRAGSPTGLRGPSRVLDTGAFAWTDDGWTPPALRDARALRAARRHVHARGHVRGGDPAPARAARARRHRDRADAGRGVPRPPRLGLRRRLPVGRRTRPTAARSACSGSSTPRTPRASR